MTELMKRYEAETGMMAQEKVCDLDDWIETSEYVAWLEDQLRWRLVSEKPKNEDVYLVICDVGGLPCESLSWFENGKWDDENVFKWLPIPPAQEGE